MPGVLGWGWDDTNKVWREIRVDSSGRLIIGSVADAEISQDTPQSLKHVPHGYYAAGPSYLPLAVNADGKLLIQTAALDHLNDISDVEVPAPADQDLLYFDETTGLWKCRALIDADIPATIARDSEVTAAVAAEATLREDADDDEVAARAAADAAHAALTTGVHGISSPLVIGHKLSARCKVYRSTSAQSIPEGVWTKIQYNAETYDNYNEFDSTTNFRFTPTLPGWYLILGCYQVELNMDGAEFAHSVYKNGAEYALHINSTGMVCYGILGVFYLVYCNGTTDYLEFYAWQQKPGQGARNLTASQSRNFVEIFLLSNM